MEEYIPDLLGGIDVLTRARIARLEILVTSGKDPKGKHAGFIINREKNKILHHTEPKFNSENEAEAHMKRVVQACKEFDERELRLAGANLPKPNETAI